MRLKNKVSFLLIIILTFLTRFLFLEKTATFVWDEPRDIHYLYQIMNEKFLTLIGPFSERGVETFGSIYCYLILPLTVFSGYDPIGPVLTIALFGSLTIFIFYFLFSKYLGKDAWKPTLAAIGWYPLLLTGRWAWNPHLGPFWGALSLLFWLNPSLVSWFFSGFFTAIAFNCELVASLAFFGFFLASVLRIKKENLPWTRLVALALGFLIGFSPLLLFELRHQFFFVHQFLFAQEHLTEPIFGLPSQEGLSRLFQMTIELFSVFIIPLFLSLLLVRKPINVKSKRLGNYCFLIFIANFLLLFFLRKPVDRYLFFVLPFFLFWVVAQTQNLWKEKFWGLLVGLVLLSVGLLFYWVKLPPYWQRAIPDMRQITMIITEDSQSFVEEVKINVAAIQSPDQNLTGDRYRFMLWTRGIEILPKTDYHLTQVLYVISTTSNEEKIYSDYAFEIRSLQPFEITEHWVVSDYWYIYRLERRPTGWSLEKLP